MQLAVRTLEQYPLTDVKLDPESGQTVFVFNTNVKLVCTPYSDAASDEDCWTLFMPDKVLTVGPNHKIEIQPIESKNLAPA